MGGKKRCFTCVHSRQKTPVILSRAKRSRNSANGIIDCHEELTSICLEACSIWNLGETSSKYQTLTKYSLGLSSISEVLSEGLERALEGDRLRESYMFSCKCRESHRLLFLLTCLKVSLQSSFVSGLCARLSLAMGPLSPHNAACRKRKEAVSSSSERAVHAIEVFRCRCCREASMFGGISYKKNVALSLCGEVFLVSDC
jgi:hypothetical protein